jgi:membrane protein
MVDPVQWILNKIKSIKNAIWHTPLFELSKRKSFLFKQIRIIVLAARGFLDHNVQLRASALTFYSLISVIPILAIAFAIAKGFGLDQNLELQLNKSLQSYPQVLDWLKNNARNAIDATNGIYIAGVGIIVLFWSVMSLLNDIENSFNHIWQISSSRPWYRKFTDWLTIIIISTVFIILSGSVTVFIITKLEVFMSTAPILDFFKPIVVFLVRFTPYFLSWFALTVLFIIMPNTKVRFRSALVAGIVAGTFLQLLQWFYIDLQFGISNLSAIYASFAAIPLFIIWLQSSWIVVLIGAEISFANQNVSRYEYESEALNISNYQKRVLTLMIMNMIIKNFVKGEPPVGAEEISVRLKIPVRLVRDIIEDLNAVGLISMLQTNDNKERLYQPALDINSLTISFVLSRLDKKGVVQKTMHKNKEFEKITGLLSKFDKMMRQSDSNILIKDI